MNNIDLYLSQLPSSVRLCLAGPAKEGSGCVIIPGTPKGKARPRMTRRGHVYTPKTTASAEAAAKVAAIAQSSNQPSLKAIQLELLAIFPVPKSWLQTKRQDALTGVIRPTVTPDFDNIAKLYCDAMNNILWQDDRQIVDGRSLKCYGENPAVILWYWPVSPA